MALRRTGERVTLVEEHLARLEARMAALIEAPHRATLCYPVLPWQHR
jgi:hypothetical protein